MLRVWQKRLRLRDWEIDLLFVAQVDLPERLGEVQWKAGKRRAQIKLLKPGSWQHGRHTEFDLTQEVDLVHELLHLKLVGWDETRDDSVEGDLMEQAVHDLSRALVQGYGAHLGSKLRA
ncbi:MAG TPA: hypothetical protein VFU47_02105 [Armatimonadota bacterium]|nr:hypothetical protein [Armatimonadota bacterium]